jgi:hypothetical protein
MSLAGHSTSKEEGEKLVGMFDGFARLDYFPWKPSQIIVKIGVAGTVNEPYILKDVLKYLYDVVRLNYLILDETMISRAREIGEEILSREELSDFR